MVRAPACHAGGRRFEPDPGRSSKVLRFIGWSCKQDCCDERQTFSFSPQTFASQIFAGAPFETGAGGCRDNCTGYASVAQSVEQGTENPRVIGSIPIGGTTSKILSFIGKSCKQDFCDEYQIFSFSPQNLASQAFAGAPLKESGRVQG